MSGWFLWMLNANDGGSLFWFFTLRSLQWRGNGVQSRSTWKWCWSDHMGRVLQLPCLVGIQWSLRVSTEPLTNSLYMVKLVRARIMKLGKQGGEDKLQRAWCTWQCIAGIWSVDAVLTLPAFEFHFHHSPPRLWESLMSEEVFLHCNVRWWEHFAHTVPLRIKQVCIVQLMRCLIRSRHLP